MVDGNDLTTDGSGEASIGLPDGTYSYMVTATGYQSGSGDVTVSGAEVTENVTLNPETMNTLAGQVLYFNSEETPLPTDANFSITLYNSEGDSIDTKSVGSSDQRSFDSYYEFDQVQAGEQYTLRIWEDEATLGDTWTFNNWDGISAADALIVSYMVVGDPVIGQFDWILPEGSSDYTPLFYDVADVNSSNSLTGADPLTIMYRLVGFPGTSPFPNNTFNFQVGGNTIGSLGELVYPSAPEVVFSQTGTYSESEPSESVYYEGQVTAGSGETLFNIYYVATGDVNISNTPQQAKAASQPRLTYTDEIISEQNKQITIPVYTEQKLETGAMLLGFRYDKSLLKVHDIAGFDVKYIDHQKGWIRTSLVDPNIKTYNVGEKVAEITATILKPTHADDKYIRMERLSEFVDSKAESIEDVTLSIPKLSAVNFDDEGAEVSKIDHHNYPNPFSDFTLIEYVLPESGHVTIRIIDKLGRIVNKPRNDVYSEVGKHDVRISHTSLNGTGIYFYEIRLEGENGDRRSQGSFIYLK